MSQPEMAPASGGVLFSRAQSEYLDVLRGLAAQLVLVQHAIGYSFPGSRFGELGLGALGVQMFFLLSGFLITQTVMSRIRRGTYDFSEFMISRFCRIYTPFVPAVLLVAILDFYASRFGAYRYGAEYNVGTAIANLFMLQDFPVFQILRRMHVPEQPWFARTFGSGRQFWTVSIEWWIYVTVGLLAALRVARGKLPPLWRAALAVAAIEPLYNFIGGPGGSLTFTWIVGAGASLALTRMPTGSQPGSRALAAIWMGVAVLAGLRLLFTQGRVYDAIFTLLLAGLVFIPFVYYRAVAGASMGHRLLIDRSAFHSYSLYLTHGSIVVLMAAIEPTMTLGWCGMVTIVLVTNMAAIPFAAAFELPHRHVRRILLRAIAPRSALA